MDKYLSGCATQVGGTALPPSAINIRFKSFTKDYDLRKEGSRMCQKLCYLTIFTGTNLNNSPTSVFLNCLITSQRFKHFSTDVKLLYGMLLDRMSLFVKNNWYAVPPPLFYQENVPYKTVQSGFILPYNLKKKRLLVKNGMIYFSFSLKFDNILQMREFCAIILLKFHYKPSALYKCFVSMSIL
ncbi:replication initiator protein A [Flintibacter sp. KGMB00164]|uniref:replication initiator protein A n=1 Tax=Flintibacter sp. KGMB00164 TaxID=2610895 RepID=UPI00325B96A6